MSEARALQSTTLAPWAEIVPGAGSALVHDLLSRPDDGWRYEVVEGVLVRVAGSGDLATNIAAVILGVLIGFVRPRRLGRVTSSDGVYKFPGSETGLLPDVGFYGTALFPFITDRDKPIPFAPELAIEIVSPLARCGGHGGKSDALPQGRNAPGVGCLAPCADGGRMAARRRASATGGHASLHNAACCSRRYVRW